MNQLQEQGYLVMKGALDVERDLQPVVDEYSQVLDRLAAHWLGDGTIARYDAGAPILERMFQLLRDTGGKCFQHLEISLPLIDVHEDTPIHTGPAVFQFLTNRRLLDAVESLIGPEILSNPVQHIRIKPPEQYFPRDAQQCLTSTTFWHQDLGVIDEEADHSDILTVFVPFTEMSEANGCVLVVPGSHKGGLVHHCRTPAANGIPEHLLGGEAIPIIMQPGDVLFFNKLTKHASLPNLSDRVRWSFDLRYSPIGQPTGRPWFPEFVARSRAHPERVLHDHETWAASWRDSRATWASREMPQFTRWTSDRRRHDTCHVCAPAEAHVVSQSARM